MYGHITATVLDSVHAEEYGDVTTRVRLLMAEQKQASWYRGMRHGLPTPSSLHANLFIASSRIMTCPSFSRAVFGISDATWGDIGEEC